MEIKFREYKNDDIDFMKRMLYEAVYWRNMSEAPSFEEAMAAPELSKVLAKCGEQAGDIGVIAYIDTESVGAAWVRYWSDDNNIRGYIDESMPVLVIGVDDNHRHKGIGGKLIQRLIDCVGEHHIENISLCVSKDNHALNLYKQQGFMEHSDIGCSLLMTRKIDI